ncbi:MAG: CRISPR-associated helicase Cas3', partial [Dehalococcoidia bacterium]
DVLAATTTMFGAPGRSTRLARAWLRLFRVPEEEFDAFFVNLWLAAAFHDLGKANDGFQRMVRRRGEQAIRHEHLSALLLWREPLHPWLEGLRGRGVDPEIVASAVVSHHLKVHDGAQGKDAKFKLAARLNDADRLAVQVQADAEDVRDVLAQAAVVLGAAPADLTGAAGSWDFDRVIGPAAKRFSDDMYRFKRGLKGDDRRLRLLLAVKAGVIAVDSAGSAMTREGLDLVEWLRASLAPMLLTEEELEAKVIVPRVRQIEKARPGYEFQFQDFQLEAAKLGPRALLLAGCGTGKTLAAWKWAAAQLRHREASRVLFLYPTRATATEGFRDYVSWSGAEDGALMTGTARYDLTGIFANADDPRREGDYTVTERLFSLAYWPRRVFSATVDSFLALMANRYAALCMVPLLAESVVIVDEVHSFSRSMFRALERFLKFFDVPVLCMTASLPEDRLEVLRDTCGLEVFPRDLGDFADLERQSRAPRYRVRRIESEEALATAREAVAADKRVLWVVNTVARCQEAARQLRREVGAGVVLCYHSRFRLRDRKRRHEEVIERFKRERPLALVTTQVCEMSLDLDADVLITEVAPPPALIQRMGRCCREPMPAPGRIGEVHIYSPEKERPYEKDEVNQGERFVAAFDGWEEVTHADLAEYLAAMEVTDPYMVDGYSALLDSGAYAYGRDDAFREDDDYTVDCVLSDEVTAYVKDWKGRSPKADGYIVPVPRRFTQADAALGAFVRVAPSEQYDADLGFVERGREGDERPS